MTRQREDQRGSALIVVGMVGLIVTVSFMLFMNSTVLTEQRAVETDLAKSRAYWAEIGGFRYALSRISYSKLCDDDCGDTAKDTERSPVLQAYFNELSNNSTWTFPEEASAYSFTTTFVANPDDASTRHTYSGHLMARSSYTASTLLAGSAGKLPLMELRICTGLSSGGSCGPINTNNGGNLTSNYSLKRLTNLPSL